MNATPFIIGQMATKEFILAACFSLFLFLGGCMKDTLAKEKLLGGNVLVSVTLNKIKHPSGTHDSYVYGTLAIEGKDSKLKAANLDCIALSSKKLSSERLYIDSVAHILTSNYQAGRDNRIKVDVYWLFTELVQDSDLAHLEISINEKKYDWGHCITFEGKEYEKPGVRS